MPLTATHGNLKSFTVFGNLLLRHPEQGSNCSQKAHTQRYLHVNANNDTLRGAVGARNGGANPQGHFLAKDMAKAGCLYMS